MFHCWGKVTIVNWDKIKDLYKIFTCDRFNLLLILPKPLIFALASLDMSFEFWYWTCYQWLTQVIWLTLMVQSFYCLLQLIDWLYYYLESWIETSGLAIIWLSLNQFNATFRSDCRFSIPLCTDLAQLYIVLPSVKWQISVFPDNHKMSFRKIF